MLRVKAAKLITMSDRKHPLMAGAESIVSVLRDNEAGSGQEGESSNMHAKITGTRVHVGATPYNRGDKARTR